MTHADIIKRLTAATGPDRFWTKVDVRDPTDCWPWTASTNAKGYGQFSTGSRKDGTYRSRKSHRVAYEIVVGAIPDSLHLDHLCMNRLCCNPAHLEPVTAAINNKRAGAAKNCCRRGHAFTPENTIKGRNGTRECRACRLERKKEYRNAAKANRSA